MVNNIQFACMELKMECVFCKIINNEVPALKVYEDEYILCFVPKEMEALGHVLVIPKKHYETLFDIPLEELNCLMGGVQKIAQHLKDVLKIDGVNLLHASGKSAGQSVNHFHIHLLPRFKEDGLNAWPQLPPCENNKKDIWERIKF